MRKASGFPAQTASLSSPRLGWKAQPSSRAEGFSQGGSPRKGEAFPHSRRQSRFGMLLFGDFDATLLVLERLVQQADLFDSQSPFLQGLVYRLATDGQGAIPHGLLRVVITRLQGQNLVGVGKRRLPIGFL